jgi:hypothetical protein
MTQDQFKIGMRIRQRVDDGDGPYNAYGHIKKIDPDGVWIKWPDIDELVKHPPQEYESIKDATAPL